MKTQKNQKSRNLSSQVIFFMITMVILSCESIVILLSGLKKGVFKKEVLSKKSNIGFDFKIVIK